MLFCKMGSHKHTKFCRPKLEDLQYALKEDSIKKRFLIGNATPYRRGYVSVWDVPKKDFHLVNARTVDVVEDAELIKDVVLEDNNVIYSRLRNGFKDENDIAVIVTKNFWMSSVTPKTPILFIFHLQ